VISAQGHSVGDGRPARFPSPRLKWLSLLGPARGRSGLVGSRASQRDVERVRCAVTARTPRAVVQLAAAHQWMESSMVFG
jgi:hypothetical protein